VSGEWCSDTIRHSQTYRVERLPRVNEKIVAEEQLIAAGGPAANAAVTFAHLGGSASLLTAIGAGIPAEVAEVAAAELASHGIDMHDAAPGQPNILPVSSIIVTAGTGDRAVI
jgi:sugar/nucleoside kinase (ribokinase family)